MAEYLLLAGAKATLRAKLSEKTRFRATASMRPLMPAGSNALTMLPQLETDEEHDLDQEPTDEEVREYVEAVQKTAKVFARYHIKTGTLAEHDNYMVWVDAWARLAGFGKYIVMDDTVREHTRRAARRVERGRARTRVPMREGAAQLVSRAAEAAG